jgi:hypothetical protein
MSQLCRKYCGSRNLAALERAGSLRLGSWAVAQAFGCALANWLADVCCLVCAMFALGVLVPWAKILVAWPRGRHPWDIIHRVHADDLAQMTWLAATHPAAAGQTFLAVDRNAMLGECFVPLMAALYRPNDDSAG